MHPHTGLALIAVSFLRLFLGGLLPSRARFRFAGSSHIRRHIKPMQSRLGITVTQFTCLSRGVQSNIVCLNSESALRLQELDPDGASRPPGQSGSGAISGDMIGRQSVAALVFVAALSDCDHTVLANSDKSPGSLLETGRAKVIAEAIESWVGSRAEPAAGGLAPWQIRRINSLIDAKLGDRLMTADLAAAVQMSKSHFSRSFHQSFGEPPHCYLLRRRIRHAKHLMRDTNQPLSEIALICGFCDQAHLSRVFRRLEGHTPLRWRRRFGPALRG